MKLKNESYRCGECKLENRVLLKDEQGNSLKDGIGNYIYKTFTSENNDDLFKHLLEEHGTDKKKSGQCFDCLYTYGASNLPIGYDSAGGLDRWCYDCAQKRCLGYGYLRGSIFLLLEEHGIDVSIKMNNYDLLELLKDLLDK